MTIILQDQGKKFYIHHHPKSSCNSCIKNGKQYIREPSICIFPGFEEVTYEGVRSQCDYHCTLQFLQSTTLNYSIGES